MPAIELSLWLQQRIEENPLLEMEDEPFEEFEKEPYGPFEVLDELDSEFKEAIFPETSEVFERCVEELPDVRPSLAEDLMKQIKLLLLAPELEDRALKLIDCLDERGYLSDFNGDMEAARIIQSLDPPGIGAFDLKHCILLQLLRKNEQNSLLYKIIHDHYDLLLKGRISLIAKQVLCSTAHIYQVLSKELRKLSFQPGFNPSRSYTETIIPDIYMEVYQEEVRFTINDSLFPSFRWNHFAHLKEAKLFKSSALWTWKTVEYRCNVLKKIAVCIMETQKAFFTGLHGELKPLSLENVARKTGLHASTISRAVKDKYLACPQGIFPLKMFFPHSASCNNQDISHQAAKQRIKELIYNENKTTPFSDSSLRHALDEQGIKCSRRTISKYRQSLFIPSASQRKRLLSS
jgi:RNA polymerase sigma-54 factor